MIVGEVLMVKNLVEVEDGSLSPSRAPLQLVRQMVLSLVPPPLLLLPLKRRSAHRTLESSSISAAPFVPLPCPLPHSAVRESTALLSLAPSTASLTSH